MRKQLSGGEYMRWLEIFMKIYCREGFVKPAGGKKAVPVVYYTAECDRKVLVL